MPIIFQDMVLSPDSRIEENIPALLWSVFLNPLTSGKTVTHGIRRFTAITGWYASVFFSIIQKSSQFPKCLKGTK